MPSPITTIRVLLVAALLGLLCGILGQLMRDAGYRIPALAPLQDGAPAVWSAGLLLVLYRATTGPHPLGRVLPWLVLCGAVFGVSAVAGHYGYYLTIMALGRGHQGAGFDLRDLGTYAVLQEIVRRSLLPWALLAGIAGGTAGLACGLLRQKLGARFRAAG